MKYLITLIIVALCCTVALGQDITKPTWSVAGLGNDDLFIVRIGYEPLDRATIGWFGLWRDDASTDGETEDQTREALSCGVFGTYDLLRDVPFTILSFSVPVTQYVGVFAGPMWPQDDEPQATAGLMAGIRFGDEQVGLGVEYQFTLDDRAWDKLANVEEASQVLVCAQVSWK